ncbi:MAG: hypothetical protein WAM70_16995, partial [Pyrinomonadaceae bacterium]
MHRPIDTTRDSNSYFPRIFESAALLTLSIGCMYCIGWAYANSYFQRVGIIHDSLNFPPDYYLRYGALPVILISIAVAISLSRAKEKADGLGQAFNANSPFLLPIGLLCLLMYVAGGPLRTLGWIYAIILSLGFAGFTLARVTAGQLWN